MKEQIEVPHYVLYVAADNYDNWTKALSPPQGILFKARTEARRQMLLSEDRGFRIQMRIIQEPTSKIFSHFVFVGDEIVDKIGASDE